MAREQEPARSPLAIPKPNTQSQSNKEKKDTVTPESPKVFKSGLSLDQTASPQPVFGRPTQLGAPSQPFARQQPFQRSSQPGARKSDDHAHLFVTAKTGANRPEFHKPRAIANPLQALHRPPVSGNPLSQMGAESQISKNASQPRNVRKIIDDSDDDEAVFQIPKPANLPTWQSKPFVHPTFSSSESTNPYFKPQSTIFAPSNATGNSASTGIWEDRFGASDPNIYLDSGRANEELKALFEGSVEDEEDESRTRGKTKIKAKTEDLADQLNGLEVQSDEKKQGEDAEDNDEDEDDGTVEGLKVKLLPHQIDGVEWMRVKERGSTKRGKGMTKGGILADDMGLGKTIQSIALILTHKPPPKSSDDATEPEFGKGTLVVAPLALIKQWEAEIRDRVDSDHALKVCVHHGPQRAKSYKELRKYDVVITTYQTLSSEHAASGEKIRAGCFGMNWYRVMLDEAHTIKNRNAKVTKAACALEAKYRWCLTGTPMQNNLDELQSLIHFLGIGPLDKLEYWKERIMQPIASGRGGLAIRRLQTVLKSLMKRRTKDVLKQNGHVRDDNSKAQGNSTDAGFKIVKRTVEKIEAEFTPEERGFYTRLESRIDQNLERMMASNKVSYASALVLLLRLRQACNHTRLLGFDLTSERDALGDGSQTPKKKASQADGGMDDLTTMFGGLDVDMKQCDVCQAEMSKEDIKEGKLRCQDCEQDLNQQINAGKDKQRQKKDTRSIVKNDRRVNRKVIVDSDDEDGDGNSKLQSKTVKLSNSSDDEDDDDDEHDEDDDDDDDDDSEYSSTDDDTPDLIASTKIRHLISILREDSHTHKYIIFSFFTSMLDLIEPFLHQHHIKFARYDGSMRNDLREASLHSLRNDPTTRVLLCSLRAGSLGLNLTAASRVVILEPFWNPFVEEQAIDRVHRLNQTQDVVVYKMTIKDTVEARILELQERKRELARVTVEGGNAKDVAKLSLAEMMKLFDHTIERDAVVDMLGMRDGKGLLDREAGEDTVEYPELSNAVLWKGAKARPAGSSKQFSKRKEEHQVYGRRW